MGPYLYKLGFSCRETVLPTVAVSVEAKPIGIMGTNKSLEPSVLSVRLFMKVDAPKPNPRENPLKLQGLQGCACAMGAVVKAQTKLNLNKDFKSILKTPLKMID